MRSLLYRKNEKSKAKKLDYDKINGLENFVQVCTKFSTLKKLSNFENFKGSCRFFHNSQNLNFFIKFKLRAFCL